ncbi:hypothetical protein BYT27DRAFT_7131295 [Phlegmacium glaucopus]|nr:hypothetical protein BYT27DRAFT_7131295 [Phlegmacium glaucopus]
MDSQVQNESAMQYAHMGLQDRRDQNLDGGGSTTFHQNGLGQALGNHINPGAAYNRTTEYRNPSTSPPTLTQTGTTHAGPSTTHSPLTFAVAGQSPAMKRKQVDGSMNAPTHKRRRETAGGAGDEADSYDMDGNVQGAKHWTDDEKSKLFTWLMGPGQEEHWNSLRATKNSCLRECATEVFGGKKTYQALKGCYERNFNLFKQIYAFETAHGQAGGNTNLSGLSEADRLREYERRLQIARKAGSDVGNITARTIDHWHRVGWYDLFYRRWHGDPATTRPIQGRTTGVGNSMTGGQVGGDEADDEEPMLDFNDPSTMNHLNGMSHDRQHVYINPQNLPNNIPNPIPNPIPNTIPNQPIPPPPTSAGLRPPGQMPPPPVPEMPAMNIPITQDMIARGVHLLSLQTQVAQEKLEYMRRREQREVNEYTQRKEVVDKVNMARHKSERAIELLSHTHADASLKLAATEYLRNLLLGQD